MQIHRLGRDVSVLSDQLPAPGIGFVPVNAFVLHAAEPVVVDTGLPGRGFLDTLGSVVDPADVRWIWLTHPDRDHTGALFDLLDAAPRARLVTNFLSAGAMSTERPVPPDRLYLLNPGQSLHVGDRALTAFRPPLYDSPATIGLYDDRSQTCFSSDCFGAPLPNADLAGSNDVGDIPGDQLRAAQLLWATVDSPWVHTTEPAKYLGTIEPLRAMDRPSSSAPTCLRLSDRHRSSSTCWLWHRTPTRSSDPTSTHWRSCSPGSNRPPRRGRCLAGTGWRS